MERNVHRMCYLYSLRTRDARAFSVLNRGTVLFENVPCNYETVTETWSQPLAVHFCDKSELYDPVTRSVRAKVDFEPRIFRIFVKFLYQEKKNVFNLLNLQIGSIWFRIIEVNWNCLTISIIIFIWKLSSVLCVKFSLQTSMFLLRLTGKRI